MFNSTNFEKTMFYTNTWNSLVKHTGLRVAVLALGTAVLASGCGKGKDEPVNKGSELKKEVEGMANATVNAQSKAIADKIGAFPNVKDDATFNAFMSGLIQGMEESERKEVIGKSDAGVFHHRDRSADAELFQKLFSDKDDVSKLRAAFGDNKKLLPGFVGQLHAEVRIRNREHDKDGHTGTTNGGQAFFRVPMNRMLLIVREAAKLASIATEQIKAGKSCDPSKVENAKQTFVTIASNKTQAYKYDDDKLNIEGALEDLPDDANIGGDDKTKNMEIETRQAIAFVVNRFADSILGEVQAFKATVDQQQQESTNRSKK